MLQWSHALTRVETSETVAGIQAGSAASMEPRTHARGNRVFWVFVQARDGALQWSHALTRVETISRPVGELRSRWASMEPRPHGRGNISERGRRGPGRGVAWESGDSAG